MTREEYEDKMKDLLDRWKRARPQYMTNETSFTNDGIADFEQWTVAKPKTMFLLKEAFRDDGWEPVQGIINLDNKFARNIARWHRVLQLITNGDSNIPSFGQLDQTLRRQIKDLALVDVKKLNESRSTSNPNDIIGFAERDKDFLKEQIDIIAPQIVVCCGVGVFKAYWDVIYGGEQAEPNSYLSDYCCKHRNRLVVEFYHPSARIGHEEMYSMFCDAIRNQGVLSHFTWTTKS